MGRLSGFLGVRKDLLKSGNISYRVYIRAKFSQERVQRFLGSFGTPEAAARQYDCLALAWRGPNAQLNFPSANYSAEDIESAVQTLPDRHIKTSVYKGVQVAKGGRFVVITYWQCKCIHLGRYKSEASAAEQYDLAQIQLYGGVVTAVPPRKLNFDWSLHTPAAIAQLLPRVAAMVAAGLMSHPVSSQQPNSAQSNKAQPHVSQAVAEPESSLHDSHSPQLLNLRQASSESDSDARAAAGALQARRQRLGRKSHLPHQQAACKGSLLFDMPGQQSTQQQFANPHPELQATAAVLPATVCQQAAAACSLSTAVPLVPAVVHVSEPTVSAVLRPVKAGKAHDQHLNQLQNLGSKAGAAKPVAQPGSMKQQNLQQLLTDDLHAAAVLVYCADDAHSTAEGAGLSRRQLKPYRRDVQAAVLQLATTIAQTVVSLIPPGSSSCEQACCCRGQPVQQAQERRVARLNSSSQQQYQSLEGVQSTTASLWHNSRPGYSQDPPETAQRQRLKTLVDLFISDRASK